MPSKTNQLEGAKGLNLSRIGQRRQVVIPKSIFDAMNLREGDFVEITAEEGRVSLIPQRPVEADDTLNPTEEKEVGHALKQVRDGKTRRWEQVKNEMGL